MTQDWSPQQVAALDAVRRWVDLPPGRGPQTFYLAGYAGTGKTTLAREVNAHVGGRALAAAYTGKAASVMTRKGMPATTVHRLIYTPLDPDTSQLDALREELATLEAVAAPSHGTLMRLDAVRRAVEEAQHAVNRPRFVLKEYSDVSGAPL